MADSSSRSYAPPLRVARLARAISGYRADKGWTIQEAAENLEWNRFKIRRQETGQTLPSTRDIAALARVYGLTDEDQVMLLDLVATAETHGWWRAYHDPDLVGGNYISYEDEAAQIKTWHMGVVPALLAEEDYVRGMLDRHGVAPDRAEQIVEIRVRRQLILSRANAPRYHAIIEESVLRRPVSAERRVMAAQMRALLEASHRDNVTVQIVPTHAGVIGRSEAFMLLDFANPLDPPVVTADGFEQTLISPDPDHVRTYNLNWDQIADAALNPEESRRFLGDMEKEWT